MPNIYMDSTSQSGLGVSSVIIGLASAPLLTSAASNVIVLGSNCAEELTDAGTDNIVIGTNAFNNATTAINNVLVGKNAGNNLITGSYNLFLGYFPGSDYAGSESSNILLSHAGVAAENHTIRIGTDGTGTAQQNLCYIAGTVQPARNLDLVTTTSTTGQITQESTPLMHTFGGGITNFFAGLNAGSGFGYGDQHLTGIGTDALAAATSAIYCTVVGYASGNAINTGTINTAVGAFTLNILQSGTENDAFGASALGNILSGSYNLGLGRNAGSNYTGAESSNIMIRNSGTVGESNVIRIGTQGSGSGEQNTCFIAGISGATTSGTGTPVLIDTTGNLGTISSSERFKNEIKDLGDISSNIFKLRPVSFKYKEQPSHGEQYGLIAEEVEHVLPKLVHYDLDGMPSSVHYHILPVLLLNELQKQKLVINDLLNRITILEESVLAN